NASIFDSIPYFAIFKLFEVIGEPMGSPVTFGGALITGRTFVTKLLLSSPFGSARSYFVMEKSDLAGNSSKIAVKLEFATHRVGRHLAVLCAIPRQFGGGREFVCLHTHR